MKIGVVSDIFSVLLVRHKMRQGVDGGGACEKNDREMTGGLYGGVQGFWVRKDIIITTFANSFFPTQNIFSKTREQFVSSENYFQTRIS